QASRTFILSLHDALPILGEMVGVDTGRSGANLFKGRKEGNVMRDLGLLVLRLTVGGLLAGHGAQKLFGWFGGFGLKGTAGWVESDRKSTRLNSSHGSISY